MDSLKICAVALALAGGACSQPAPPQPPTPPPPAKTVFDPLTEQLQRAKGVQATVDRNTATTGDAVNLQERGDDAQ